MKAVIFVALSYGVVVGKSLHFTAEAASAEGCLFQLEGQLQAKLDYRPKLTFRPADGMIFCGDMSPDVPLGVIYRENYLPDPTTTGSHGTGMTITRLSDVSRWLAQHVQWKTEADRDKMRKAVDLLQRAENILEQVISLSQSLED